MRLRMNGYIERGTSTCASRKSPPSVRPLVGWLVTSARFFRASVGTATCRRVRWSPRQNSQRRFRCRCEYFAPVWGSLNCMWIVHCCETTANTRIVCGNNCMWIVHYCETTANTRIVPLIHCCECLMPVGCCSVQTRDRSLWVVSKDWSQASKTKTA